MLQVKNIHKEYRTGNLVQKALDGVSLNLRDNEFVAILGPSGSGKTTFLNIIGGLDRYDEGDLIINGISTKKYKDRDWDSYRNHTIGFVFQSYNLIPHQTILANVELALTISGVSKSERRQRAQHALEQVGLGEQGHKKPNQLSGGQMQRVAIARALVNDPDILLADEPTGALDSVTSVQVMELLKEVAKDRLVVMVTHNPELAEEYATRIVELRDGRIRRDSDPFEVDDAILAEPKHQNMGKSSMSWLTSLALSFNNLKTKKGRTFLTAFAGSIGIIGIALILSLSTGVNQYIQSIEEETLSEYPLTITSTGIDLTGMMLDMASGSEQETSEDQIQIFDMLTNMFSKIGSNDIASLKTYFDDNGGNINDYVNSIEYEYNISPQIYSANTETVRQVHPDQSFTSIGLGSSSSSNSLMSSMMSTNVFSQMPEDPDLYMNSYDVKAGRWPENRNECVLVLTANGSMSDFMLYTLGLRDFSELDEMVNAFAREENVTVPEDMGTYTYDDILGITFKVVNAYDYYRYDETYGVYVDKTDDTAYMQELIQNGEDLTIVGVVQPSTDANAAMLTTGICYPASLTEHVINEASNSEIVQKQLADPTIDVFTGNNFNSTDTQSFDLNSIFTIDTATLQSAFRFDTSALSAGLGNLDLSGVTLDLNTLPEFNWENLFKDMHFELSEESLKGFSERLQNHFQQYLTSHGYTDETQMGTYFLEYIQSDETQAYLQTELQGLLDESGLLSQFESNLQQEMQTVLSQYGASLTSSLEQQISSQLQAQMSQLAGNMQNAISIDADKFAQAIQVNMTEEELSELMLSMMSRETTTYESNLSKLQYASFDSPSSISIYPLDFESKQEVINILDTYNERMQATDEEKVIAYTDYVGTLMSSVTDIVNVISYVLVAFVAISLIVSSIMIGVITYISVLERKKEIGILRAIGASKRNISQVFNAETFIIGLLAGAIGIGITCILLIPGNMIIHDIAGTTDVSAILPVQAAVILVLLSVILTILGGLIPSSKAAKEDPVKALRTE
ncbi:Macrolide export ATP-binding/permease protein MacB [Clostridiales bacterium CHKCI006]|nr:Macrolide export ATP-binding/permease protein MacB [Clostridiales bacterium CHKCI006]